MALQERLVRAGYRDGEALYRRIRSRISRAFATPVEEVNLHIERRADRLANWIWVGQRDSRNQLKDCDKLLPK